MYDLLLWVCLSTLLIACVDDDIEPDVVPVTGVSLNKTALALDEGESESLIATVIPDNATNKKVTWKSSDTSVATVNASGKVTAQATGTVVVVVITEDGAEVATCTVTCGDGAVEPEIPVTDVVLNKSTLSLIEGQSESLQVIITPDDATNKKVAWVSNDESVAMVDVNGKVTTLKAGSRNSVGVSETQEVFAKVFSNSKYQADSYGLVYWSHGDGWLPYPLRAGTRWVGQDKGNGDNRMNISEFVEILKSAPHFDFILFDACFMQAVEVAYELRDYTDYCIGSPTEIPGPGASYDAVVPAMFSAENAAVNIAKAYYEPYAAKYDEGKGLSNSNWTAGASVCALRTDKLVDLARITKQVLPGSVDNAQLRSLIFDYDKRRGSDGFQDGHVGYYDMANMMKKITDNGGYLTWRQAFDAAVVYWATTSMNYSAYIGMFSMEGTNGVSCYIPSVSNTVTDKAYRSTEWYTSAGFAALGW